MLCYLNIETIPPFGTLPSPSLVKVPRTIKKTDTREKYLAENTAKAWKELALHRWTAQIGCYGLILDDDPPPVTLRIWANEKELLTSLREELATAYEMAAERREPLIFVAFNGIGFDYPMIRDRAIKYEIPDLAGWMHCPTKWPDAEHWDPFLTLGGIIRYSHESVLAEKKGGSLDDWLEFYGITVDNPITGSQVSEAMLAGQTDLVARHNASRVLGLREITRRLMAARILRP